MSLKRWTLDGVDASSDYIDYLRKGRGGRIHILGRIAANKRAFRQHSLDATDGALTQNTPAWPTVLWGWLGLSDVEEVVRHHTRTKSSKIGGGEPKTSAALIRQPISAKYRGGLTMN